VCVREVNERQNFCSNTTVVRYKYTSKRGRDVIDIFRLENLHFRKNRQVTIIVETIDVSIIIHLYRYQWCLSQTFGLRNVFLVTYLNRGFGSFHSLQTELDNRKKLFRKIRSCTYRPSFLLIPTKTLPIRLNIKRFQIVRS